MKTNRFFLFSFILTLGLGSILPSSATIQTQPTVPVGFMTYDLPAVKATTTAYLCVPLQPDAVFTGSPTEIGTTTITVSTAAWTSGAFAGTTPYYVYVKTGAQAGRVLHIVSNTSTKLTLNVTDDSSQTTKLNTTGFALATTDTFEICPGDTLGGFFGESAATSSLTLTGTTGSDYVSLWSWKTKAWAVYSFSTVQGHWVDSTGANANNTPLPPNEMIAVTCGTSHVATQLYVAGQVPTVAPLLKSTGHSIGRYFGSGLPVDITLADLDLGTNWTKGSSATVADKISLYNATTSKWVAYYESTDGTWKKSGSTASQNAVVIAAGAGVIFTVHAAVSGSTSFFPISLPYDL